MPSIPSFPFQSESVRRILQAAMRAADSSAAIRAALSQRPAQIASAQRIFLLAVGKAGIQMTEAALPLIKDKLAGGLVVTKHASRTRVDRIPVMEAGHPLPDARSLEAGQRVLNLLPGLTPRDLLVCLISGGASALLAAPRQGISLENLREVTSILLAGGAGIDELNLLRKRLDHLKGGGLARRSSAPVLALILSDVIGDRLDLVASGLTVPDATTRREVQRVVSRYDLAARASPSILAALNRSLEVDSCAHAQNLLVGTNAQALRAAQEAAIREGFQVRLLPHPLKGEARHVGRELALGLRRARAHPLCLIAGGETTVTVTGEGRGGRNQELALAAALELDGAQNRMLISFATDGEDGTTGAAGAVVSGETLSRARALGLEARDFLRNNDSYAFFAALGDLIITGPTGTNVNDLVLLFKF